MTRTRTRTLILTSTLIPTPTLTVMLSCVLVCVCVLVLVCMRAHVCVRVSVCLCYCSLVLSGMMVMVVRKARELLADLDNERHIFIELSPPVWILRAHQSFVNVESTDKLGDREVPG